MEKALRFLFQHVGHFLSLLKKAGRELEHVRTPVPMPGIERDSTVN
jgi:hypothetical protein